MKVAVIGTGYVGLVTGTCLAEIGSEVICLDMDEEKVRRINSGMATIYEKGLQDLLTKNIGTRLQATTDPSLALSSADISIIAVGTPFDGESIDLEQIKSAAHTIGEFLGSTENYHVVIVKSTVIPGTTESVVRSTLEAVSGKKAGRDFGLAMNPEFLREGVAIQDFMEPDRIVIGGIDNNSLDKVEQLYQSFEQQGIPIIRTSCSTAEMIKYANNSLFATLISFSNEIGNLCARLPGIDVLDVMAGVHMDKRLSPRQQDGTIIRPNLLSYLASGCGFGGSCFPKDVKALSAQAHQLGLNPQLLDSVITLNADQVKEIIRLTEQKINLSKGRRVTILGLAFKPDTDDIRESPAIGIIEELLKKECSITAYDPMAMPEFRHKYADWAVEYSYDLEGAIDQAEIIIIVTCWDSFEPLPNLLKDSPHRPIFVDCRRMFNRSEIENYIGVGINSNFESLN